MPAKPASILEEIHVNKIILSELMPETLANSPESLTALIAFPIRVKVKNRPIIIITIRPAIKTLKFLGVISINKYVCLLSRSKGKFWTLPVANKRYRCRINIDNPIVTTKTASIPDIMGTNQETC